MLAHFCRSSSSATVQQIDVSAHDLEEIRAIFRRHLPDREVVAFGSRVTGAAKRFSDLDLAIMGDQPIPAATLADLREEFDESNLPFKVDLVEWATTAELFRRIIARDAVSIDSHR